MKYVKTLEDLSIYHQRQLIERARHWRLNNHSRVLELLQGVHEYLPPSGSTMFFPERWTGANWNWFRDKHVRLIR